MEKRAFYKKTTAVYKKVKEAAPNWARSLHSRSFKVEEYPYEKLLQSWKWSQLNQRMKEIFAGGLEDYEKTVSRDSVELREKQQNWPVKKHGFIYIIKSMEIKKSHRL